MTLHKHDTGTHFHSHQGHNYYCQIRSLTWWLGQFIKQIHTPCKIVTKRQKNQQEFCSGTFNLQYGINSNGIGFGIYWSKLILVEISFILIEAIIRWGRWHNILCVFNNFHWYHANFAIRHQITIWALIQCVRKVWLKVQHRVIC